MVLPTEPEFEQVRHYWDAKGSLSHFVGMANELRLG